MSNPNLFRDFERIILVVKLHEELTNWSSKVEGIVSSPDGTNKFKVILNEALTTQEDTELHALVMQDHIPSDAFLDEKALTDQRNAEGFALYKKIFAHISANEPITSIDQFITFSDKLHKLRNFLKDGNFETAVRYMELEVKPVADTMFPNGYPTYRQWIREIAIKYSEILEYPAEAIIPHLVGTPYEGIQFIDYIEQAPQGQV